jgi:transposase
MTEDIQTTLPKFNKVDWAKYNLAKTSEKRFFYQLLFELCQYIPEPNHFKGRKPIPVRDLVFMCALKIYSNYSARKVYSDLKHAEMAGYIKKAGHFNRLSDFLNSEGTYELLSKLLTITALPLKELEDAYSMDASGFGSYQYERWKKFRFSQKFGGHETRNYIKGHICIGTRTNIIVSAEATYGNLSDIGQAPQLLEKLKHFQPKEVSADKGYSSHRVHQIIESLGAIPYVLFKQNSTSRETAPDIWNKMFNYFKKNKGFFLDKYHKRSNVESTFSMIKMRLGEFLRSNNYEAQRNELMMKFLVHNITCLVAEIFENDVHVDFRGGINLIFGQREDRVI